MAPASTKPRPRLPFELRNQSRPGAGVALAMVSDEQIIALIDAGLSRAEIAQHFGVEDHNVRYRVSLIRKAGHLDQNPTPYGRFFIDTLRQSYGTWPFLVPVHRRDAWLAFKAMKRSRRPDEPPHWAVPLSDTSLVEFTKPLNVGGFARDM